MKKVVTVTFYLVLRKKGALIIDTTTDIRNAPAEFLLGAADFTGPLDFDYNHGRCNVLSDDCVISTGGWAANLTGRYVDGLSGNYSVAKNCGISCQGCSAIPYSNAEEIECEEKIIVCKIYAGFFYCSEYESCIDSSKESCPLSNESTTNAGPTSLTCNESRCNTMVQAGLSSEGGCPLLTSSGITLEGVFFDSLFGEYNILFFNFFCW
jgi:hypothetical protein